VRKPYSMRRPPICRSDTPVTPNWRTCAACLARKRSGTKRASEVPSAAAAGQSNKRSATGLNMTIRRFSSMVMIASIDDRMMPSSRASPSGDGADGTEFVFLRRSAMKPALAASKRAPAIPAMSVTRAKRVR
jgi:hypothetical protein